MVARVDVLLIKFKNGGGNWVKLLIYKNFYLNLLLKMREILSDYCPLELNAIESGASEYAPTAYGTAMKADGTT